MVHVTVSQHLQWLSHRSDVRHCKALCFRINRGCNLPLQVPGESIRPPSSIASKDQDEILPETYHYASVDVQCSVPGESLRPPSSISSEGVLLQQSTSSNVVLVDAVMVAAS